MNKFKTWLESERGLAKKLSVKLGVTPSSISNAKVGKLLICTGWMPTIVAMSKGKISFKDLVTEREITRKTNLESRMVK